MSLNLLLDRDGVINKLISRDNNLISPQSIKDFEFKQGSKKALRKAEEKNFSIYIISNQPDVSKNWRKLNKDRLNEINQKLKGLGVDSIFNCTHGPLGERKESRYRNEKGDIITCDCRKPQPGLIKRWYKHEDVSPKKTVVVGDKETDIEAAEQFEKKIGTEFKSKINLSNQKSSKIKKHKNLLELVENLE
jgi:D-glycero-D-manno-heptose 1,7-bisphosphate phosphatase